MQSKIQFLQKEIQMARTKQTARLSCQPIQKTKKRRIASGAQSAQKRLFGHRSLSPSSSSQAIDAQCQQFSLKFDNQPQCQKKSVAEPRFECKKCKAFLNSFSVLEKVQGKVSSDKGRSTRKNRLNDAENQLIKSKAFSIWVCEFCHERNEVPETIPIPKDQNPCYLLSSAVKYQNKTINSEEKVLIYCIDISGSMDTLCQNKRRLDAVRQAIRDEIKRMKFQGQKIKIGIVLFGSYVIIKNIGKDVIVPSNLFMDFEQIVQFCDKVSSYAFPIQNKFAQLQKIVNQMCTYGSTALGPGLLTSIQLASRKRGSKVVLCTDGQANIGLLGPSFYTKVANYAKQKGVMVSILSLKGDNCNLKELGKIALSTGGGVMKIDPKLLGGEFNKISKEDIFGTDSNLRIVVNHFFEIQNSFANEISADKTILTQDFGNFTADTQLTFNFKILTNEEALKKGVNLDIIKQKRLPMQVQLTYQNPNGAQYLQVVNDHRELTLNAADVFNDTNFALFSSSSLQKISRLIKEGKFEEAEREIKRFKSLVQQVFSKKQKPEDLKKFNQRMKRLQNVLKSKMLKKTGIKAQKKPVTATKTKTKAKPKISKEKKKSVRGRRKDEESEDEEQQLAASELSGELQVMESDNEEEILYYEMRAREND